MLGRKEFMTYIFSNELTALCDGGHQCPPPNSVHTDIEAWRWVANPATERCFEPQAVRNPRRLLRATDLLEKCSCWGLSMHLSRQQSTAAFLSLKKHIPNADKIFGGHNARVRITPTDGACTAPDRYGHFDFHPFLDNQVRNGLSDLGEIT